MKRRASEIARPLRAEQDVVLPHRAFYNVVEDRVHVLGRIGQRRLANDLAPECVPECQFQSEVGLPEISRGRSVLGCAIILAIDAEEMVRALKRLGVDFSPVRHILHVFE